MFQADGESGGLLDSADAFSDKVIRLGFMRKVYSILSLQLLLTTAVAGLFYIDPIRNLVKVRPGTFRKNSHEKRNLV